jgi:FkbM family methyltransferase
MFAVIFGRNKETVIEFRYRGRLLKFLSHKGSFDDIAGVLNEIYIGGAYKELGVEKRDVVDIGAFTGETAIYFTMEGARHVYAFEPSPANYKLGTWNINKNGLENKIDLFHAAVMGKAGKSWIPDAISPSGHVGRSEDRKRGKEVKTTTLNEIVKKFKLKNAVLKVDCEGAEYEIIEKSDSKTLRSFSKIIIEYTYGMKRLREKLERSGFKTETSKEYVGYVDKEKRIGYVLATRID